MDPNKRKQMIIDRLRVKPIYHGELETTLIDVPEHLKDVPMERIFLLKESLEKQKGNLVSLLVRRSKTYDDEGDVVDRYEVVYGADWCVAAKELKIERLWVWVFDMDDEQAELARTEMNLLMGSMPGPVIEAFVPDEPIKLSLDSLKQVVCLLDQRLEHIGKKFDVISASFDNRLTALEEKVNLMTLLVNGIPSMCEQLSRLEEKFNSIDNLGLSDKKDNNEEKTDLAIKVVNKKPPKAKTANTKAANTNQLTDLHLEKLDKITLVELLKNFSLKESKAMSTALEKCRKLNNYKVTEKQLRTCANSKSPNKVLNFAQGTCDKLIKFAFTSPG